MKGSFLKVLKERFDCTELELVRVNFIVIKAESTLIHYEKHSLEWYGQLTLLKMLRKNELLMKAKLASLAIDLNNEKVRIGL